MDEPGVTGRGRTKGRQEVQNSGGGLSGQGQCIRGHTQGKISRSLRENGITQTRDKMWEKLLTTGNRNWKRTRKGRHDDQGDDYHYGAISERPA